MLFVDNMLHNKKSIISCPYSQLLFWTLTPDTIAECKKLSGSTAGFETAAELFQHSEKFRQIKFNVESLDELTEGGIDVGSVTEIFGEAGSGKTQLCLQLALQCQLPTSDMNGVQSKVIYISTDKSLSTKRLETMALALGQPDTPFLDNIFVYEFNCSEKLLNFVGKLPKMLRDSPSIRLLIVDSVAGIFRAENDYISRAKKMREFVQSAERLSDAYNFAILKTNHVTSVPQVYGGEKKSHRSEPLGIRSW